MADKLPQSVEELLAAHKAVVDAMSPKQRTAYYAQIAADQIEYARPNPYKGGERQAQAEMPKGIALVADTDPITAEFARAAIAAAARLTAENASLTARVAELTEAGKIAAREFHAIAGMEFMGVSAVAYNAARALEAVLAGEGGE